jgi:hypothetical protein
MSPNPGEPGHEEHGWTHAICDVDYFAQAPSKQWAGTPRRVTWGMLNEIEIQNIELRAALTAALEQNERFAAELRKLRTLIDTHNDERRECPVIEA